ncbi:MAG TPA: tetratricopeptide repeat protein [Edaphobacter sp.]|nr:tetratricopeptide repeat protein [Edaphobacter sp.]
MKLLSIGIAILGLLLPGCVPAQQTAMQRDYAAAQRALASGDVDGALSMFEQLSRTNPAIAEIHATLGVIRFQKGDYPGALKELDEAKRLKPALPRLDGLIAMSQAEMGEFKQALPALEETFRTAKDEPVKRMSGLQLERVYTALQRDDDAVKVAMELQRLFPSDPEVLYHNGRIFGNFAFLTMQKLAAVAPDSIWRQQAAAEAYESQGSFDQAIATYRHILTLDPKHRGIHYRIGRCLRERERHSHHPEDLAGAMAEFQQELKLNPDNANASYEIGELHRLAGENDAAKASFEAALKIYPDFPEANLGLATVLSSLGQPEKALPYLKVAIKNDPGDEASWYRLSLAERSLGHRTEQEAAMKEFLKLHKNQQAELLSPMHDVSRQEIQPDTPAQPGTP